MSPILDESSLVPYPAMTPGTRIQSMGSALQALDRLGAQKVLRSVRDAADRDIEGGRGLREWCFDRGTDRDAGRLVANRLSRQPFIDGESGLFAIAEGPLVIEASIDDQPVLGLGLAALQDEVAVALCGPARLCGGRVPVQLTYLDESEETRATVDVLFVVTGTDVEKEKPSIEARLHRLVDSGAYLLANAGSLFPHLRFGALATGQIHALGSPDSVLRQLVRHLRALDAGAMNWTLGTTFAPGYALAWSDESNSTLDHRRYGPMRDFSVPTGFTALRWRFHTKLTAGAGYRLYFRAERSSEGTVVLIGYFGPHLPTVKYPT